MNPESVVADAEHELRLLASALTEPRQRECLLCYVYRMLEHGCTGLRWATLYRDLRAPRATALERRLGQKGGYCDCEIFMNGYALAREHWVVTHIDDGDEGYDELVEPEEIPDCRGARAASTKGCALWVRRRRGW
jgi:hypothetical protein